MLGQCLFGRGEAIRLACLDLDEVQHLVATRHDIQLVGATAPIAGANLITGSAEMAHCGLFAQPTDAALFGFVVYGHRLVDDALNRVGAVNHLPQPRRVVALNHATHQLQLVDVFAQDIQHVVFVLHQNRNPG